MQVRAGVADIVTALIKNKKRVALMLMFFGIYLILFFTIRSQQYTREQIDEFIGQLGINAIVAVYLIQVLFSLSPFPDGIWTIIAVIFFGPMEAFAVIFLGCLTGSMIHYVIARRYGNKMLGRFFPNKRDFAVEFNNQISVEELIIFRFFAMVSFDITAYFAGMTGVPFRKYLPATMVGLVPIIFSNVVIAMGIFAESKFEIAISWLIAGAIAFSLALLAKMARKQLEKNGKNGKNKS